MVARGFVVPWWSPSKFVCWEACPRQFFERYVQHQSMVPTVALHFGTAIHRGLEAHFIGQDGEVAFRRAWRELSVELVAAKLDVPAALSKTGLDLVEKVANLGLSGTPERKIWVRTEAYLSAPLLGYADLWCDGTIIDFKTTVGSWSVERAEKEVWQPCLYSYAYWLETGELPKFEYIVLNRATGDVQRYTTQRRHEQISDALSRARQIAVAVENEAFDCTCRTGADCPECGAKWEHSHQCFSANPLRIRLGGKAA